MKVNKFLQILSENTSKAVLFEYQQDDFVPRGYHLTEVKKVFTDGMDCGGNGFEEKHTSIQLWSPQINKDNTYMTADKMLKIIKQVDKIKPLWQETDVYFEYGNKRVPTSSFSIQNHIIEEDQIIFRMYVQATACRPLQLKQLKSKASNCCNTSATCC